MTLHVFRTLFFSHVFCFIFAVFMIISEYNSLYQLNVIDEGILWNQVRSALIEVVLSIVSPFQSHSQFAHMEWRCVYYANHIVLVIIIIIDTIKKMTKCLSEAISVWKSIIPIVAQCSLRNNWKEIETSYLLLRISSIYEMRSIRSG